jgi:hypothetical protein
MSTINPVCINSSVLWDDKLTFYSTGKYVFIGFIYSFAMFCSITSPIIFWWFRRKYSRLQVRQTLLVTSTAIGVAFQANAGPLMSFLVPYASTPCALRLFLMLTTVPLIGGVLYARLVIFFFMSSFAQLAALEGRRVAQQQQQPWDDDGASMIGLSKPSLWSTLLQNIASAGKGIKAIFSSTTGEDDRTRLLWALRFLVSPVGVVSIVLAIQIPFMILAGIIIATRPEFAQCFGCILGSVFIPFASISAVICILGFLMAYRVRMFKDPWGLRSEVTLCIICVVCMFFSFIMAFQTTFDPSDPWDWQGPQTFFCTMILVCQSYVQILLAAQNEIAKEFNRNRDRKGESTVGGSRAEAIHTEIQRDFPKDVKGILASPPLAELFEKHLVDELCIESLLFYRAVNDWKKSYSDIDVKLRKTRAKKLFKVYIDIKGLYPVNIPDYMYRDIEKVIKNDEEVKYELFDAALKEITKLMQSGSVPRFLRSKRFFDYQDHLQPQTSLTSRSVFGSDVNMGRNNNNNNNNNTATTLGGGRGGSRESREENT